MVQSLSLVRVHPYGVGDQVLYVRYCVDGCEVPDDEYDRPMGMKHPGKRTQFYRNPFRSDRP